MVLLCQLADFLVTVAYIKTKQLQFDCNWLESTIKASQNLPLQLHSTSLWEEEPLKTSEGSGKGFWDGLWNH